MLMGIYACDPTVPRITNQKSIYPRYSLPSEYLPPSVNSVTLMSIYAYRNPIDLKITNCESIYPIVYIPPLSKILPLTINSVALVGTCVCNDRCKDYWRSIYFLVFTATGSCNSEQNYHRIRIVDALDSALYNLCKVPRHGARTSRG